MGRPELGSKFQCTSCHERSYDLNRTPVVCPRCGVQQAPHVPRVTRPPREPRSFRSTPAPLIDDSPVQAEDIAEEPDEDADEDAEDEVDSEPDAAEPPE